VPIERIILVLNTDEPEQDQLYNFVKFLPNGRKRNASAFLRLIVDREFQRQLNEKKNTGGIKFRLD
jgi:hypothetical protein